MQYREGQIGLATIANRLKQELDSAKKLNLELLTKLKTTRDLGLRALVPIDIPTMNEAQLKFYDFIKKL